MEAEHEPCICQGSCKVSCACKRSQRFCVSDCHCMADTCTNRGVTPSPERLANPVLRCYCKLQWCQARNCPCYKAGVFGTDLCYCPDWCKNIRKDPRPDACICAGSCDFNCHCHNLDHFCIEDCACDPFSCQNRGVMARPPMVDPTAPRCKCQKNQCSNNSCSCRKSGKVCTAFCTCMGCNNIGQEPQQNVLDEAQNNVQDVADEDL
ncbi:hypothetical protein PIB30_003151 [Stylosanthes scabra]|uniref:CRC domain-containing protein n=1 Tax=Stylosanthes scabra TaxID=79078 RepID=A0ABU6Z2Z0_9FABA|nr:hypothetical protein [Stylosanthes scabra]